MAPLKVNEDTIRIIAISKLGWIKRQQRKFEGQQRISQREYKSRESHYFYGRRCLLNAIEVEAPPKVVLRNKTSIDLYVRPKTSVAKRHEILNEWNRKELKKMIPELIEKWENEYECKSGRVADKTNENKMGFMQH